MLVLLLAGSLPLKMISSSLDVVSHKNTRYQKVCMCVLRLVSIKVAEISAHHLQFKCMGRHFFTVFLLPSLHRECYHTL